MSRVPKQPPSTLPEIPLEVQIGMNYTEETYGCRGGQGRSGEEIVRDGHIVGILIVSSSFFGVGLFLGWLLF